MKKEMAYTKDAILTRDELEIFIAGTDYTEVGRPLIQKAIDEKWTLGEFAVAVLSERNRITGQIQ